MRKLGESNGVEILAPDDASLSFFNSPYIGHQRMSSVDIYPAHNEWNGPAFAPTTGTVHAIKSIRMGKEKKFQSAEHDYAIGIKPDESSTDILRILHCKPSVKIGDVVECGDDIGSLIRSRYFNFWTGPHYHVEVMSERNFNRPSQSHILQLSSDFDRAVEKYGTQRVTNATWVIEKVTKEYLLASSESAVYGQLGTLFGNTVEMESGETGVLDAGIPYYSHGGAFGRISGRGSISMGEKQVGMFQNDSRLFLQNRSFRVFVNDTQVRGISNYIYTKDQLFGGRPPLKIIPQKYGGLNNLYREGDSFTLSLRYQNHH